MTTPTVLVTGGAGFVGSHTCKALAKAGYLPVVYDDLSNGVQDAVRWGPLEIGALEDEARLAAVVAQHKPVAVVHFAAFIEAGESVREPERFYRNNVGGTLALLRVMRKAGVDKLVFSSSAAVYGNPEVTPIPESHPLRPVNPYGCQSASNFQPASACNFQPRLRLQNLLSRESTGGACGPPWATDGKALDQERFLNRRIHPVSDAAARRLVRSLS